MNPRLDALHPYPFEKLRALLASASAQPDGLTPINLSIGEPKHAAPERVAQAIRDSLGGLSVYPSTKGDPALRQAIANWLASRYSIPAPDAETQVLPALGSREALFAFTQTVIDPAAGSVVICPNPFYQIYEGATLLAGATPYYVNADALRNFACDWNQVPDEVWKKTRMVFVCSPGNPAGNVMTLDEWEDLFALSDRHGFVIASDECYSEIYLDEGNPPLGGLQAARHPGRNNPRNLVAFSRLSKRSKMPGLRSGFVAGELPHVSWQRHEPAGVGGQHRRLDRRGPRQGQPPPVPREIRGRAADPAERAGRAASPGLVLPVGGHPGFGYRVCARPLWPYRCYRAAGQFPGARGARCESWAGAHPPGPGGAFGRLRAGGRTHRPFRTYFCLINLF